jgi:hypothetical protein
MDKDPQVIDISKFTEMYHGYPLAVDMMSGDILSFAQHLEFDESEKYDENLRPKNKLPYPGKTLPRNPICIGRVTSEPLADYYLVEVYDGQPHPIILVHKSELVEGEF